MLISMNGLDIVLEVDVMNQHILDNNFQQAVH